ncbi:MAG: hypothetical protein U0575_07515 [Phycisphaerales bacterium]
MRIRRCIIVAVVSGFGVQSIGNAEVIKWTGAGKRPIWEDKLNWNPKRVPGPNDDVVIPGDKGEVIIAQDYTLENGVPKPAPKKLKSFTIEKSTALETVTNLRSAEVHDGMPAPLKNVPVNIVIETSGDIALGELARVRAAWGKPIAAFGVPGAGISLTSTAGSVSVANFASVDAGDGATGVTPDGVGFPRGPGGSIEVKAKKAVSVGEASVYGGAVVGGGGVGAAASGGVVISAGDDITIRGVVAAGLTTEGVGGSVAINAGKKLTATKTSFLLSGFSGTQGDFTAGGLALVSGGLLTLEGMVTAKPGPHGGNVVIFCNDIDNKTTVNAGDSTKANTAGGDILVTVKAANPTKVGKLEAGDGKPKGTVTMNGKKIALGDRIRAGQILVKAVGGDGTAPEIVLAPGADLQAESLICLDAGDGVIDLAGIAPHDVVLAVTDPGGFVNLVGEVELAGAPGDQQAALDPLIDGAFGISDVGCTPESCFADIDLDGVVDEWDLTFLLALWGTSDDPTNSGLMADLDLDGVVGSSDLSLLLAAWGPC